MESFLRFSESGREDLVRHLNVVTDTYDGLSERESFEGVCSSTLPSVSSADVSIEMVDMTRNVPDSAGVRAEDIFEPRPREMRAPCPDREVTASLETPNGSPGGDLSEQVDLSYMSAADILKNAAGVMTGACDPLINGVTAGSSRRRHGRSASMSAARGRVPGDIPWPPAGRAGAGGMSELRRQRGGDIATMFDMEEIFSMSSNTIVVVFCNNTILFILVCCCLIVFTFVSAMFSSDYSFLSLVSLQCL